MVVERTPRFPPLRLAPLLHAHAPIDATARRPFSRSLNENTPRELLDRENCDLWNGHRSF